jgi:hypothetical protein
MRVGYGYPAGFEFKPSRAGGYFCVFERGIKNQQINIDRGSNDPMNTNRQAAAERIFNFVAVELADKQEQFVEQFHTKISIASSSKNNKLRDRDSNPNKLVQSQLCYRYTIPEKFNCAIPRRSGLEP